MPEPWDDDSSVRHRKYLPTFLPDYLLEWNVQSYVPMNFDPHGRRRVSVFFRFQVPI